ncbi:hypothetical protein D3OALGB2SA_4044 [Olavius algarvensis associated proteobacterium Delta 3]|nr:hypothetical protein D3OALGB2SA_4044 [Olavius algarvensis associated proteobacterium Delta 3]
MTTFTGTYFDGRTSAGRHVSVSFNGSTVSVRNDEDGFYVEVPQEQVDITAPLGRTTRVITFADGARLETDDHAAVSTLEQMVRKNRYAQMLDALERRWPLVLASLAGIVAAVLVTIHVVIPVMADKASRLVPATILDGASKQTLTMLDARFFGPTTLDRETTASLEKIFNELLADVGGASFSYRLELRNSPIIGPNAFALPSGTIVVTDQLVALATDDRALAGVLAHELAHVEQRHGLRSLFQNAGVFLLISLLVGDVTSVTSMAATMPTLLIESGYSRDFEEEADLFAGEYMTQKGWGTRPFRDILQSMAKEVGDSEVPSFFLTHPGTDDRLAHLRNLDDP